MRQGAGRYAAVRVTLTDIMCTGHQIETFSPGLLRTWLGEWLPLVVPVDPSHGIAFISIWPSFELSGEPDWLCDSRVIGDRHPIETHDPDEAMLYIGNLRKSLEAEVARLEAKRAAHR